MSNETPLVDKSEFSLPAGEEELAATPAVYLGLFLVSFSTLLFEIILTRIFSAAMWYHFAFMVLSLVMFGMTIGAAVVYRLPNVFSKPLTLRHLSLFSGLFAILMPVALITFLQIPIKPDAIIPTVLELLSGDFSRASFLWTYVIFALPFICSGICTCLALTRFKMQTSQLYGADLIGASLACLVVVALLSLIDAPSAVLINAVLSALAAYFFALAGKARTLKWTALLVATVLLVGGVGNIYSFAHGVPLIGLKQNKTEGKIAFEKWSPTCHLNVEERPNKIWGWGLDPAFGTGRVCEHYWVNIDNHSGTPLYKFDGDLGKVDFLKFDVSNIVHSIRPNGDVFVIGMGGGKDILGALLFEHRHIVGAEFNTAILDLLHHTFNSYTGKLDHWPGVELVNQEARSYLASSTKLFEVIQGTLAFTGSAVQCGGLALTENSLYTVEAWRNFLSHLTDTGILSITLNYSSKRPFLAYKICSLACQALAVQPARDHIVLIGRQDPFPSQPYSYATLLVSKSPLSPKELDTLEQAARNIHSQVILSPRSCLDPGLASIADENNRANFFAQFPLNIDAPTDDRPFFFCASKPSDFPKLGTWTQIVQSQNIIRDPLVVMCSLFLTIGALTIICILLPLTAPLTKADIKDSLPLVIYFSSLGIGFMMIEVSQMERLTIFLGHPIFGLTIVLFTLLLSSGLGSLSLGSSSAKLYEISLFRFSLLALALLLIGSITPIIAARLTSETLAIRIIVSALLLAVPGFFMGMPLPLGISMANARGSATLSAWLWGINGATSVLGSILATTVSLCAGIQATFWIGVSCYFACLLSFIYLVSHGPTRAQFRYRRITRKVGVLLTRLVRKARSTNQRRADLLLLTVLGILMPFVPWLNRMVAPIDLFTAGVHQLSHATISIILRLPLEWMFADDKSSFHPDLLQGGGLSFLCTQSAYLLVVSLGCLAIAANRWPKFSQAMILTIGSVYSLTITFFTLGAIFRVGMTAALIGMVFVMLATFYFVFASVRFDNLPFRILLLSISVQTAWIAGDSLRCLRKPDLVSKIVSAARANVGQRLWINHRTITHWGDLACAVAVTHVLRDAGVAPIDELSVGGLTDKLCQQGWQRSSFKDRRPGDVIIAVEPKREHTGIVDFDLNTTFSNHSSSRRWGQDSASYWLTHPFTVLYVLQPPNVDPSVGRAGH
jgi:hypothetical protein